MKQQTAVQWLVDQLINHNGVTRESFGNVIKQANAMENKEKLKHQLFIGKVTEILGFDKTFELLKQCNDEII